MEGTQLLNIVQETASVKPSTAAPSRCVEAALVREIVLKALDDNKAEDVLDIDLTQKSSIADFMMIASGRSSRHVGAIADKIVEELEKAGERHLRVEGQPACDWVLIDAGDVIVHVFRPEVREFYKLEKLWMGERPTERASLS